MVAVPEHLISCLSLTLPNTECYRCHRRLGKPIVGDTFSSDIPWVESRNAMIHIAFSAEKLPSWREEGMDVPHECRRWR